MAAGFRTEIEKARKRNMPQQKQREQRRQHGIFRPWDGPARPRKRRKLERGPQLSLRFPPEYDRENPLANLFPEAHASNV
jgi:hypothetical protein